MLESAYTLINEWCELCLKAEKRPFWAFSLEQADPLQREAQKIPVKTDIHQGAMSYRSPVFLSIARYSEKQNDKHQDTGSLTTLTVFHVGVEG